MRYSVKWEAFGHKVVDADSEEQAMADVAEDLSFTGLGYLGSSMEAEPE